MRKKWRDAVVNDFVKETGKIIELIASFSNMYKPSSFDKNVRVAQVRKLSSRLYAVSDEQLTLLYIVDSRQEPFWQ